MIDYIYVTKHQLTHIATTVYIWRQESCMGSKLKQIPHSGHQFGNWNLTWPFACIHVNHYLFLRLYFPFLLKWTKGRETKIPCHAEMQHPLLQPLPKFNHLFLGCFTPVIPSVRFLSSRGFFSITTLIFCSYKLSLVSLQAEHALLDGIRK